MQIPEDFLPDDLMDDLVEAAVRRILMASGLGDFLPWFSDEVHRLFRSERITLDTRETRALATQFGRSIWGATPAPHNDFRPQPLPKQGRNASCYCGSGVKYKNYCARFPALPPMSPAEVWPAVLNALPQRDCRQVVESGRVPVDSLVIAAEESRFVRDSRRAIGFLEPMFGENLAGTGGQHGYALKLLCDLYDDAGWTRKKTALLDRIITEVPRSELRSDAFQRLATIRMDQNDPKGAWDAFRRAQRDSPGDPSVGLLEVNLHIAENQPERARESALIWRKRLMKRNIEAIEGLISYLAAVAEDPYQAMAEAYADATGGTGRRLVEALPAIGERPLPQYEIADRPALDPDGDLHAGVTRQLRGMGILEEDIRELAPELIEQTRSIAYGDGTTPGEAPDGTPESHFTLRPPEHLRILEADWHAIYSPGKPFSIDHVPRHATDPWHPSEEDAWMDFLDRHPEAFDSIDVLDDLATAVELHPMSHSMGFREAMQAPLIERAVRILRQAIQKAGASGDLRLPWTDAGNRPALRCLTRAQYSAVERKDVEQAQALAELLLALNPNDNHGVRTTLMNIHLRAGDDDAALSLASNYEDDMFAELSYGRVLALVRLDRMKGASVAAQLAVDRLPEVRRYLMRERAAQPRMGSYGVALGSKEQAWLYREEMRELWLSEPKAMALIRRTRPSPDARDG